MSAIRDFIHHHYRHFNAAALVDAADGYRRHLDNGGVMFMTLAGAMSTAELGLSLAEMIRKEKVHAICCTGANLEEDIFNLVAHEHYVRVPNYRELTADDEEELLSRHLNRVTDTCIPEEEAIRRIEDVILDLWQAADTESKSFFPHEFMYQMIRSGRLEEHHQIDPKDTRKTRCSPSIMPNATVSTCKACIDWIRTR
jgi:deoxyhypusine synthase